MRTNDEQERKVAIGMLLLMILVLLLATLNSCASQKPIKEVEYITLRDSIYITKIDKETVRDSIYIKDKGDTLYIYRYKYIDRYKVDTIIENHTDTVYKTVTDTVYIEKHLTWWQQTRLALSNILFGVVGLCLLALGYRYRATIASAVRKAVKWIIG